MCEQRAKITIENNNKYMTNENICISRSNHLQWMSDVLLMSNADGSFPTTPCEFQNRMTCNIRVCLTLCSIEMDEG